jgi:PKD repeat protein
MKNNKYLALGIGLVMFAFSFAVKAKPVTLQTAATVALNYYNQAFNSSGTQLTLAYTETSDDGQPVYYVFNINANGGFVIVAADDAAHPILGYSNKGQYVIPRDNNNVAWWMNCRKQEIMAARKRVITATQNISDEWTRYVNNVLPKTHSAMSNVAPLVQTMWDQPNPYNDNCPGGSVTGCVATCMAQILRYWSYPAHGTGYSSYYENQADGYWSNFGYLSAIYDTSNYVWSAMPYSISSYNYEIANLMYDCGVSVDMDYSPGESGAWVVDGDYPVCSQNSYVKYFGYNPKTVKGVYKSNYTYKNWQALIMNEMSNRRPVQYVGNDSVNNAGHTWVCDGDSVSSDTVFHMNWGWGGADNGYFALNALFVGYDFDWWDEAVIGIQPAPVSTYFSGSPTFGCGNLTVQFNDSSISTTPITSYKWMFPGGNPSTSPLATPTVSYNTPGTYDVTEIVTSSAGTDTVTRKAYISVGSIATSGSQNFQSSVFPPAGWVINNPYGFSYTWQINTNVGGYGNSTQCMYFNNTQVVADYYTIYTGLWVNPPGKPAVDIIGQKQQIFSPEYDFTNNSNPEIYFDVAYAPFNNVFSDTLNVYYSTDCGSTFHPVYSKGGMTLGTTGNMVSTGADTNSNGIFVPASNNWRTDTIHIAAIAGAPSVMFSFENESGNGAALYIDNITIPGTPASTPTITSHPSVKVYPNPTTGIFTIQCSSVSGKWSVEIYDVVGENVYSQLSIADYQSTVDLSAQPAGVYIYRIFSENGSSISTGRLVVE